MDNLRVIIKPKGLIALGAIGATVVLGVVATQLAAKPADNAKAGSAVGSIGVPSASPTPADVITDDGEKSEKGLLDEWNKNAEQGRDWLFLGPLPSGQEIKDTTNSNAVQEQMDRIMNTVYLPNEAKYQAKENATFSLNGKSFTWKKVHGCSFDFKEMFHSPTVRYDSLMNVVVYGVTDIESSKEARKVLRIRSDDGAIVWLNGDLVYKNTKIRGVRTDEETAPLKLRAGHNSILVKVGQGSGGWGMMFYVEDPKGKAKTK